MAQKSNLYVQKKNKRETMPVYLTRRGVVKKHKTINSTQQGTRVSPSQITKAGNRIPKTDGISRK